MATFPNCLNLTQHEATPAQIADGVFEPSNHHKAAVKVALTFDECPNKLELLAAAHELAEIAKAEGCDYAMIGGAPYLMSTLENALIEYGIQPVYSFSLRKSVEQTLDGVVKKVSIFEHVGFVEACR